MSRSPGHNGFHQQFLNVGDQSAGRQRRVKLQHSANGIELVIHRDEIE